MKLLTLNCHSWQEENQREKIRILAQTIIERDYDVIALQEVSQSIKAKVVNNDLKDDNYVLVLLEEIKSLGGSHYDFFWDFSHIGYDKYEEGLAILSKSKINDKESFFITNNNDRSYWKTRKIVKGTIDYKGEKLDIYSCHLGWWNDVEELFHTQAKKLLNKIKEGKNRSFIMGDFNNNALIEGQGYSLLKENGLLDTYEIAKSKDSGITVLEKIDGWEENEESLRLDIIFTNKNVNINSSKVIFNGENKEKISDHFGVEIEI